MPAASNPPGRTRIPPHRKAAPDVKPLPGASTAFAPLPRGALLNDGRFHVIDRRSSSADINVYLVEDSWPVRVCPHCGERTDSPVERFCTFCGADLTSVTPLSLRHLARERIDELAFAAEARLLKMRLDHPGLILPHDFFVEAPYGPPRRYLVEPAFPLSLAATLPVPQKTDRALDWGMQLAQALDYLHRHGVFLKMVDLNHISLQGRRARWNCLDVVQFVSSGSREQARASYASNVTALAALLFYLATGQERYATDESLPEPARAPFAAALGERPTLTDAAALAQALEAALEEIRQPTTVTMTVGYRTDVGQVRMLNEDSLIATTAVTVFRSVSTPVGLFGVADGMGGHQAGDVASQSAIRVIAQRMAGEILAQAANDESLPDPSQWLPEVIQAANHTVHEKRVAAGNDMGTTLVVALVVGHEATVVNVGDSRAYKLNRSGITRITVDHSLVERLVTAGQITPEAAAVHPQRNVIYRTVGDKPEVEVDLFAESLQAGEALLLCSDGLSGKVADDKMWHIWRTSTSPQETCDRLVEAANQAGGEDNITVVIVQLDS
jgi:serine/threonine protein phosphatase PrpC